MIIFGNQKKFMHARYVERGHDFYNTDTLIRSNVSAFLEFDSYGNVNVILFLLKG